MPAVSEKQRRFMAADYQRAQAGEKTKTGMAPSQLHDFMSKPKGGFAAITKKGS